MRTGYIGRYRVLGELGRGAMGVVYRGLDETLDRELALKVMSATHAGDEEAKKRFLREGKAAGRLQHPNIVTVFELGEHGGAPFMAMELLEGRDLQQAIKAGLRPDPRVTLPIVLQVLSGLAHAHEHGIVHRDIKPSNVFLPRGRPAKIMDFGIARLMGTMTGGSSMTSTGAVIGTPHYMSPEQVRGAVVDARADLFSTGLILFELVTGERAYQADSIVSVLFKIAEGPPDLRVLPRAPEWRRLRQVLERALAHDPADRYSSAAIMEAELHAALAELGGAADATTSSDRGLMAPGRAAATNVSFAPETTPVSPLTVLDAPEPAGATEQWAATEPWRRDEPWSSDPALPSPAGQRTYRHVPAPHAAAPPTPRTSSLAAIAAGVAGTLLLLGGGGFLVWRQTGSAPMPTAQASPAVGGPVRVAGVGTVTAGDVRPAGAPATTPTAAPTLPPTPAPPAPPTAAPTMAPTPEPMPEPTPETTPEPTRQPRATPAPTPVPTTAPEPRTTPEPTPAPPEPAGIDARLERANALFDSGRFAPALAEAKAILAREPNHRRARILAEDAEAAIAVEQALDRARDAIRRGDTEAALQHVRTGLAISPNEGRLMTLFRQLQALE